MLSSIKNKYHTYIITSHTSSCNKYIDYFHYSNYI